MLNLYLFLGIFLGLINFCNILCGELYCFWYLVYNLWIRCWDNIVNNEFDNINGLIFIFLSLVMVLIVLLVCNVDNIKCLVNEVCIVICVVFIFCILLIRIILGFWCKIVFRLCEKVIFIFGLICVCEILLMLNLIGFFIVMIFCLLVFIFIKVV